MAPPILLALMLSAQPQQSSAPLFADDAPLAVTLTADFAALRADRADEPEEQRATLVFEDPARGPVTVEIDVRPRGNFRRDPAVCTFTPLRLDLPRRSMDGTVFDGQNRLKMVAPCRSTDRYQELVLVEYLLYRAYALVTGSAFDTRLIHATFVDATGKDAPFTRYGFVLEHHDALAERLGATVLEMPEGNLVRPPFLNAEAAVRAALFQYMIGNADWSDAAGHNVELLTTQAGPVVPVPYDFDFSGAVDAPYAVPPPDLGLRNVRERVYRGWCFPGVDTAAVLGDFRAAQGPFEEVVDGFDLLSEGRRRSLKSYLGGFFEDIATDERAERRILRDCRALS